MKQIISRSNSWCDSLSVPSSLFVALLIKMG